MPKKLTWLPVLLCGIISVVLLFPDWLDTPNTKVIEGYGDGYKAYHAILYHAKHDSTYSWYEGMNYPYGEHVVPGASQPLLSNGMRLLEAAGVPAADYGWAVVHFSILFGIVMAMLFTFLLLQRLGVRWWLATLGAVAMTLMAPQLDRIIAHYGLSHTEVLPAVLYYLKRWDEKPGWLPALAVALCVWLFSQIHFYYFAILAFTIGGFLAARWLILTFLPFQACKEKLAAGTFWKQLPKSIFNHGLALFLMFGLPAIYFFTWFGFTDPVADRNEAPWGFFTFLTGPMGILTSHTQPYWQWFRANVDSFYPGFEGWAYIGLPAVVFLGYLLVRAIKARFKAPFLRVPAAHSLYLHSLLLAAFGVLIFSFGFPIKQLGGEALLEHLGPLRQFRSIGRFAWLFYYAINLALFVELEAAVQRSKHQRVFLIPLLLTLVFAFYEVHHFWQAKDFRLDEVAGLNSPTLAEQTGLDFSEYQAIIPVPYYNIGSDNFWWEQSGFVGQKVQTLSWQTGLSTNGAMLTRTSLSQTLKQFQFITEPYRTPALLADLPNDKPFLLAFDPERYDEFGDHSAHLAIGEKLVYDADGLQLYRLPISSWQTRLERKRASVKAAIDTTHQWLDSLLISSPEHFFYASFDEKPKLQSSNTTTKRAMTAGYHGQGFSGNLGQDNRIVDIPKGLGLAAGKYVFSFWMDIAHDRYARSNFTLEFWQPDGTPAPLVKFMVQEKVRVMDTNGWALIEIPVEVSAPMTGMLFRIQMPLLNGRELRVDDVLLRPTDTDVYQQLGDTMYYNNRYYPPHSE